MKNKSRFWTGVTMGAIEVLGMAGYYVSGLPTKKIIAYGLISAVVIYNLIAGILVWNGSQGK